MSREFVRNIKNTVLKGDKKEPLKTNIQNDLLSDKEDVYVRNQDEYHCLTDNIKEIVSPNITVNQINKNKVELISRGEGGEAPDLSDYAKKEDVTKEIQESLPPEVKLLSTNDKLTIEKNGVNDFTLTLTIDEKEIDLSNYYTKDEIKKMIESLNISTNIVSLSDLLTVVKEDDVFTLNLDLTDYATNEDVDNKIKDITLPENNTNITSISDRLMVDEKSLNNFELDLNLEGIVTNKEVEEIVDEKLPPPVKIESANNNLRVINPTMNEFKLEVINSGGEADLTNYYDKSEVDELIDGITPEKHEIKSNSNLINISEGGSPGNKITTLDVRPSPFRGSVKRNMIDSTVGLVAANELMKNNDFFIVAPANKKDVTYTPITGTLKEDKQNFEVTILLKNHTGSNNVERQITFKDFDYVDSEIPTTMYPTSDEKYKQVLMKLYRIDGSYILKLIALI